MVEPWGARNDKEPADRVFKRIADERGLRVKLPVIFDYLLPRTYPNTMKFLDSGSLPTAIYALDDEVSHRIIDKLGWKGVSVPGQASRGGRSACAS